MIASDDKQQELFNTNKKLPYNTTVFDALSDLPKITDNWKIDEVEYSKHSKLTSYQKLMRKIQKNSSVITDVQDV